MADTGSLKADEDLRTLRERFKLTLQSKPKQFLGMKSTSAMTGASRYEHPPTSRLKQNSIYLHRWPSTPASTRPHRRKWSRTTRRPRARNTRSTPPSKKCIKPR
eukprot:2929965-Pleurochrysis_carterae.AAC.1